MALNQDIRDDLVVHDIDLRRVDGWIRKKLEARVTRLSREVAGIVAASNVTPKNRARAIRELESQVREVTNAAYAEIRREFQDELKRIAKAESSAVLDSIKINLP